MRLTFTLLLSAVALLVACTHRPDAEPEQISTTTATTMSADTAPAEPEATEARRHGIIIPSAPAQAIRNWLRLVDAKQYGESWDAADPMFQSAVTRTQWMAAVEAVRKPLGNLISREQISTKETTSLPGAPDGDYYIYEYKASYEGKKDAVETVTAARGAGDQWRVVGYFIH